MRHRAFVCACRRTAHTRKRLALQDFEAVASVGLRSTYHHRFIFNYTELLMPEKMIEGGLRLVLRIFRSS